MSDSVQDVEKVKSMLFSQLFSAWRFAPVGDQLFTGESGNIAKQRLSDFQHEHPDEYTALSKQIGW